MLQQTRDVFVILAGVVAAGTFLFSVITGHKRLMDNDIHTWQKSIIFEIVASSEPQPISFQQIKDRYISEAKSYQQHDIPRTQLDDTVTRRILLELIGDGALRLSGESTYSINIPIAPIDNTEEINRIVDSYQKIIERDRDRLDQEELHDLGKNLIFEIVSQAAPEPLTFERIQEEFVSKARSYAHIVTSDSKINRQLTRRVLLDLIAERALVQAGKNQYSINLLESAAKQYMGMADVLQQSAQQQQKGREIMLKLTSLVGDNAGGYTEKQLVAELIRDSSISKGEAVMAVNQAQAMGLILFIRRGDSIKAYLKMDLPR